MAYTSQKLYGPTQALALLISLVLLAGASCARKSKEQAPAAFEEAENQAKTLLNQLEQLGSDDIMQLEVRAGRLLLDQRVLDNPAAAESLKTTQDFLSHFGGLIEELTTLVIQSREQIVFLREEWLTNKDNRPSVMERFFGEQQRLSDLVMQADYLVNRWNAQLLNIENFEQAFPQNMDE